MTGFTGDEPARGLRMWPKTRAEAALTGTTLAGDSKSAFRDVGAPRRLP
jgi:hypothetical protein